MSELLDGLNDMQRDAVLHKDGPLLLLAGAGSGKTRVITHRIAYLIAECDVNPYQILALTFTNKAAGEMRERVDNLVGESADRIWVSTFHSTCVRILRRYIDRLDYERSFSIYDADDQKALMKDILKSMNLDPKKFKERTFLNVISSAKDEMLFPEDFAGLYEGDFNMKRYVEVYYEYQKRLKQNNALDFDDLIMLTVKLFREEADVLDYYQERFRYIMVDEYQDTNTAQFKLLALLAAKYKNLCVVGDDDQSIYKFRGANIHNILNFEKVFSNTTTIRLEQNYRSTKNILAAASEVIKNNNERKEKTLWTKAEEGHPIVYARLDTDYEEAMTVVGDIRKKVRNEGASYSDFAVLYRTNAQSRIFEEKLVYEGIPYRIIGSVNFYSRKEIKDLLSYLKTVNNGSDDIAVKRIINVPKRGIGATSIDRISDFAMQNDISFYDALSHAGTIPGTSRSISGISSFLELIESLRDDDLSLEELLRQIIERTGYQKELEAEDTPEAEARIENIESLIDKVVKYEETAEEPTLSGLLEEIALVADIDTVDLDAEQVKLMTLHGAKGLEFKYVYMVGMEEGVFPGGGAVFAEDDEELEEERRLCYVGITRAKKQLIMTGANQRMRNGKTEFNRPSRFINEIPRYLIKQVSGAVPKKQVFSAAEGGWYTPSGSGSNGSTKRSAASYSSTAAGRSTPKNKNNLFSNNPYISKGFSGGAGKTSSDSSGTPDYAVGDTVSHVKFGEGVVKEMVDKGSDFEVTVEFEDFGQRKLRSSFAKLEKI